MVVVAPADHIAYNVDTLCFYGAPKVTFSILFSRELFRNYELLISNYELLFRIYELLNRFYELLSRFYELLIRKIITK